MAAMATTSVTIADISDGLDGTGISSTKIEYQAGSSGTSAPTGTWSTSVPSTSASAPYLWTRVTYNYSDGRNPEYVYSVGSTPEGIEIGGRNLLPKAKYGDNIKNISNNSVSGYGYIFSEQSTSPNPIWSSELNLQPGVSYTLSFIAWIDVSDNDAIQALCVDLNPDTLPQKNYDWTNGVTNVPTKFVWTFKSTHSDMLSCRLRFFCDISSPDGYKFKYVPLYITDIKLEEGNKATDWTPAPEDVDEAINRVDVKTEQLDDKLHWMVKSGTSATDFTLTDRTAKLVSDYINLNGLVSFSGLGSDTKKSIIDSVEVGGRNLARNTSSEWSDWITPTANTNNVCHTACYAYLPENKKEGDNYTISIEIEFSGVSAGTGGNFKFSSIGSVDGVWTINNIWCPGYPLLITSPPPDSFNSINAYSELNKNAENAIKFQIAFRADYWGSGKYRYRKIKIEKGNKATDWTPAPEDIDAAVDTAQAAADGANSTLANWCYNNDKTYINGGKIATGSITATQIDVDSIFAQNISAKGTITGGSFIGSTFEGATGSFTGSVTATSGKIGFMDVTSTDISLNKGDIYGEFTLSSDKSIEISDIRNDGSANIFNLSFNKWKFNERINYIDRYECEATPSLICLGDRGSDGKKYVHTDIRANGITTKTVNANSDVTVSGYSTKNTILNHVRVHELTIENVTINSSSPWSMSLASIINSLCDTTSGFYGACLKMCWPHSTWAFACTLLVNGTNVYIATTTTQVYDVRILIFYNPYL